MDNHGSKNKSCRLLMRISSDKWYTAREAAALLDVTEETVKDYCRRDKIKGRQVGPRKQWHVRGTEIERIRKEWNLDIVAK